MLQLILACVPYKNKRKMLVVPEDFFIRFKSSELNVGNSTFVKIPISFSERKLKNNDNLTLLRNI